MHHPDAPDTHPPLKIVSNKLTFSFSLSNVSCSEQLKLYIYFNSNLKPGWNELSPIASPLVSLAVLSFPFTTKGFHHYPLFANQLLEYMCEAIREALSHIIRLIVKSQY